MIMGARRMGHSISEVVGVFDIFQCMGQWVCREYTMVGITAYQEQRSDRPWVLRYLNQRQWLELFAVTDKRRWNKSHPHSMTWIQDAYPSFKFSVSKRYKNRRNTMIPNTALQLCSSKRSVRHSYIFLGLMVGIVCRPDPILSTRHRSGYW